MSYIDALLKNKSSVVLPEECKLCFKKNCSLKKVEYYIRVLNKLKLYTKDYDYVLKQDFICLQCEELYLPRCVCCDKLFHIKSTLDAWDDAELTKSVIVCVKCYSNEACTLCRYLGGSSPCKYCR
jgi:hypothetical protein